MVDRYHHVADWPRLRDDVTIGDVGGVAVDAAGLVYVFNRGPDPMLVFDRDGALVDRWGRGTFTAPHGIALGPDGHLWLTDDGDHTVRKCTTDGEVLLVLGEPGKPAPFMSGRPLNRPTHSAIADSGEIWISDGYGNGCLHCFSRDGHHLLSIGRTGSSAGEFYVPHNIVVAPDGRLIVADRENHRLQVFDRRGGHLATWDGFVRPMALAWSDDDILIVGEAGPSFGKGFPNLGPRLSFIDAETGRVLGRFGAGYGTGAEEFMAPHGIAVAGDTIYVGEVAQAAWRFLHKEDAPSGLPTLRKLVRHHVQQG